MRAAISARSFSSFGVGLRGDFDLGEVGFEAHPVPAGGLQILGGADKGAGTAADGGAQGAEVAAGFRGEKDERLLGLIGNGDEDALFARAARSRFPRG